MEIFVVDGLSEDSTRHIVQEYHSKYPFIHTIENVQRHTPIGMNLRRTADKGAVLSFLWTVQFI